MLGRALTLLLVLVTAAFAVLWFMRYELATGYVDRELARRGVRATYEVSRIGLGSQVLENVVIGDPARPDLVARRVEVRLVLGLSGLTPGLITARGVRMRGTLRDGRISLGQVDRLLPPPSDAPFRLPDQRIDVADAAILLDMPAGPVALGLTGRGNLADGFRGSLAARAHRLQLGSCALDTLRAGVSVAVDDLAPRLRGPVALGSLHCVGGPSVARPLFALDATLAPGLESWRGRSAVRSGPLRIDSHRMTGLEGRVTFAGNSAATRGELALASGAASVARFEAGLMRFAGTYVLSLERGAVALDGQVSALGLRLDDDALGGLAASLRAAEGSPLGPIGDRLAAALVRAARSGGEADAALRFEAGSGGGRLQLSGLDFAAASGARLRIAGGDGLALAWPSGALRLDGIFALSGGGFPDARLQLRQAGAALSGTARIAAIQAGTARLALGEVAISSARGGGLRVATRARIDGPFAGGQVRGLSLPLAGRLGGGGFTLGEACVTAGFESLQVQTLRLGPSRLALCPVGRALVWRNPGGRVQGGAELRAPRFAGRLGGSPIALAAARLRVGLDGLAASAVSARLDGSGGPNWLEIASLDGRFGAGGAGGTFAGLSGDLANVPLIVSEGEGRWRFASGRLETDGAIRVSDKADPPRFEPLASRDFRLVIDGNAVDASGWLLHPASGTLVTRVRIDHDLASGAGDATLDVPGIAFTPEFQPEALTRLTIGVVALVDGTLRGEGRIAWDAAGTRSTGTFSTTDMNLAAPFGPVERLTTTIDFTDLLGLASAPGQVARVGRIQAGVDVFDGVVRYQLLPDYRVAIEGARWPFSGGTLDLEPTTLDFSRETTKYLTFRVTGLDAARFIEQMEFSNIAATGTFDGIIPMQFDEQGAGRIVGGRLAARPEGGTLSYVGELSDRDLGTYGILAFNALKSLRYSRFALTLDGALDGEFITVIDLDGIARDPAGTTLPSGGIAGMVAGRVFRQLARIPFEFNIRIQGQFRALLATARSFNDPTPLIQSVLPQQLRERATTVNDVQDEESEPVR